MTSQYENPLPINWNLSSEAGNRIDPITGNINQHRGIDIAVAEGTPVYAAADGKVIISKIDGGANGGYGEYIAIQHSDGTKTIYGHLEEGSRLLNVGDEVIAGQKIGLSGNTGKSTGPHLHFGIISAGDDIFHDSIINPLEVTDRTTRTEKAPEIIQDFLSKFSSSVSSEINDLISGFSQTKLGQFITDLFNTDNSGSSKPVTISGKNSGGIENSYTIQSGDTLSAIAASLGTTTQRLLDLNPQLKPSTDGKFVLIKSGDKLTVPVSEVKNSVKITDDSHAGGSTDSITHIEGGIYNNAIVKSILVNQQDNTLTFNDKFSDQLISEKSDSINFQNLNLKFDFNSSIQEVFGIGNKNAPLNNDGTINLGLIDNSQLNLTINTDLTSNFRPSSSPTQIGSAIDGGDYRVDAPTFDLNSNGAKNVLPYGMATDNYRPGNNELSAYANFNTSLSADFSKLDNINNQINSGIGNINFNTQLQNPLANITNESINARSFVNIDPVVLDLNNDGIKLISYQNSEVSFDVDNDNKLERTGWVNGNDGILVDDTNNNGKIDNITETISEYYNPNSTANPNQYSKNSEGKYSTDGLDALKKLDSNHDGKFNSSDAKWSNLKIWQDKNENGITEAGELKTLAEVGVKEINLASITQADKERNEGNVIFAKTTYTDIYGTIKQVAAVDFTTNPIGYEFNDVNLGKLATSEEGTKSLAIGDENGAAIKAINAGETITNVNSETDAQNIFGNIGDDTITGNDQDNWLSGGKGSDTLHGGKGDDILIIDAQDKQENIDGGEGRDIVIINSDQGVTFNLAQANVETVTGGNGDDVLIGGGTSNVFIDGGSGDDIIIGGAADDALAGSDGNDYLDGGYGDDILRGHRGNDILNGGKGDDLMDGGLDDDKLYGGEGKDILIGGAGSDEIDGGEGYDLAKYSGSYADYDITKDGANYKVRDLKTGATDVIKNVEGIRFDNVTIKLGDNVSPLAVADQIAITNNKNTIFIAKNDLLKNDLDVEKDQINIKTVENAVGGKVELVKLANGEISGVNFTPDQTYNGVMSFDYSVAQADGTYSTVTQYNNDGTSATAPLKARVQFKLSDDPQDPLYYNQWYLSEINVKPVWQDYSGKGVTVGVFEKGDFNYTHQDLRDNVLASEKKDQEFREVEQFSQHKTTVAGVIAAEKNDYGIIGVAYDAKLDGYGWDADSSGLGNLKNVDIANNSWGDSAVFDDNFSDPTNPNQAYAKLLEDSVKYGRGGLGTIDVFAGGNQRAEGDNVNYHNLQNSRFVITTGSINQQGDLGALVQASTPFSNPGAAILVSAPGSNIQSTGNLLTNENGSQFLGEFSSSQGTSFSAPIVSGIVALMLEANPNLGYRDVQKILALTARKFDDPNAVWQENGAQNWNGGKMHFSNDYGFGIVDAKAAVRLAETWNETNNFYNEQSLSAQNNFGGTIADNDTSFTSLTVSNSKLHNLENVEVAVNLSSINLSDLTITLISPNGTRSVLMDQPKNSVYEGGLNFTFSSRNFLGEDVDGEWKLEIKDSKAGDVSYLNNWKINFYGKLDDGKDDVYVYTDEFAKVNNGLRATINDKDGGVDSINASAVSSDSIINLNAGAISKIAGQDVLISGGTAGDEYYAKQAELTQKQSELPAKDSDLQSKQNILQQKQNEFAGIDAVISAKVDEFNKKDVEYKAAMSSYNVIKTWFDTHTFATVQEGYYIFFNVGGGLTELTKDQYQAKVNSYNSAIAEVNRISAEENTIIAQHKSLSDRKIALPNEITAAQETYNQAANQVDALKTNINFLTSYLASFNSSESVIENAYAGDGNDTLIGNSVGNILYGGRGHNALTGNAGDDIFVIKKNATTQDIITDFKVSEDKLDLSDFSAEDIANAMIKQDGANTNIIFQSGQKIILQNVLAEQVLFNQTNKTAITRNVINGTDSVEAIAGTAKDDVIDGRGGQDVILAKAGNDEIHGGAGDDLIYGGAGNNTVYGDDGNDRIYGNGDLDTSTFTVINSAINKGDNNLFGGAGDDIILGGIGKNYIDGGEGDDQLFGGASDDIIIGGGGSNKIQAGAGNDTITLGSSRGKLSGDDVWGESGSDKFIISAKSADYSGQKVDFIYDFDVSDANEKIDLSNLKISKYSELNITQNNTYQSGATFAQINFGNNQFLMLKGASIADLNASKFIITNAAPIANSDSAVVNEDAYVTINVLLNDADDKTSNFTKDNITIATQPKHGSVSLNYDGTATYKPSANYNGDDFFEYKIKDSGGLESQIARVNLVVNPVNDAPILASVITDKSTYITKQFNFSVSGTFSDIDSGDTIFYKATLADGSPLPNWVSFDAATLKFSGTSPSNKSEISVKLIATDSSGASSSTSFKLKTDDQIIFGTAGDDIMTNSAGKAIDGAAGNDKIYGANDGGASILFGGDGSDTFVIKNTIITTDTISDFNITDPNEKIDLSALMGNVWDISQFKFLQTGDDVVISVGSSSKNIVVKNVLVNQLTIDKFIGPSDNKNSSENLVVKGIDWRDNILYSGKGDDVISGGGRSDFISAGLGNNTLSGGDGRDTFTISKNPNKTDIIKDFTALDSLAFNGFVGQVKLSNFQYEEKDDKVTFNLGENQKLVFENARAQDLLFYSSFANENLVNQSTVGTALDEKIILPGYYSNITLNGGDGNDLVIGGDLHDVINGGKGNDSLYGGKGCDIFEINKNSGDKDIVLDLEKYDSILLKGFADGNLSSYPATQMGGDVVINLGDDQFLTIRNFDVKNIADIVQYNNRVFYQNSSFIQGGSSDDLLIGSDTYYSSLYGKDGNDVLIGGGANDLISGGTGKNILVGGAGADQFVIDGSSSDSIDIITDFNQQAGDRIDLSAAATVNYFSGLAITQQGSDSIISISNNKKIILKNIDKNSITENYFTGLKDVVIGKKVGEELRSMSYSAKGAFIDGKGGNDEIHSTNNDDIIFGGDGDDLLWISGGNDALTGGAGVDTFALSSNSHVQLNADATFTKTITDFDFTKEQIMFNGIYGVSNISDISISDGPSGAVISYSEKSDDGIHVIKTSVILNGINASQLDAHNFQFNTVIEGDDQDNAIIGTDASNYIYTRGGNDNIDTKGGNDYISLGAGNKIAYAGDGDDVIYRVDVGSSIISTNNSGKIYGDAGNDTFYVASAGTHELFGGDGDDFIHIATQNSKIFGGTGDDTIIFGDDPSGRAFENNEVYGDAGNDILYVAAQSKNNILSGGSGDDTFIFRKLSNNSTTIVDFEVTNAKEKIDLKFFDINSFDALQFSQNGADTVLDLGDGQNIILKNTDSAKLSAKNFIFKIIGADSDDVIKGSAADDYIIGGAGNNKIYVGAGNDDYAVGGSGNDTFVIEKNPHSYTTIVDFEVSNFNEKIQIKGFYDVVNFDDISINYGSDYASNNGKYIAYINLGDGQQLEVRSILKNSLTAQNFEFYSNSNPVASVASAVVNEDNSVVIDVLSSANDIDDDALAINSVSEASHGIVKIIDDKIIYTPNANFNGSDKFDYTIFDDKGGITTQTINVAVNSVNDAPTATNATLSGGKEDAKFTIAKSVLLAQSHAADVDGDTLAITSVASPIGGKVNLIGDNVVFTPTANFNGIASFNYKVSDGKGASIIKTATLNIAAVNDAPTANNATLSGGKEDAKFTVAKSVLLTQSNAADIDGDTVFIASVASAVGGKAYMSGDNIIFSPTKNYNGIASFNYKVSDGKGASIIKTATINIAAVNDAPTASDIHAIIAKSAKFTIAKDDLLAQANATDIDGDKLSIKTVGNFSHGKAVIENDNIIFNASVNYTGEAGFNYTITDNKGALVSKHAAITIVKDGDALVGTDGADIMKGGSANDIISGGNGNDIISAGSGNDKITGGLGADSLTGGFGHDTFIFTSLADSKINASDFITDFTKGEDRIDFSALGFTSIGEASGGVAPANDNILAYHFEDNQTVIENHDGSFAVKLAGQVALTNEDFNFG